MSIAGKVYQALTASKPLTRLLHRNGIYHLNHFADSCIVIAEDAASITAEAPMQEAIPSSCIPLSPTFPRCRRTAWRWSGA